MIHTDGPPVRIGPMVGPDLEGVLAVEKLSFSTPWSRDAFEQELFSNQLAYYIVARIGDTIAGYAGMWLILDEAHVTNVAVHPQWRGYQIGEKLMRGLIARAVNDGATRMTLEVRASNRAAQALYIKLGFKPAGLRPGYYTDSREDAVIMWLDPLPEYSPRRGGGSPASST